MGISLHDSVVGEGPDVVLLHGLFGQGSNLGMIARGLQDEFRVHTPDLPDHGRSAWTETPSITTYAAAVSDWMQGHGLNSAHFIGHSLGGKVAMQLAFDDPSRVDKLVVADIAPVDYPPGHEGVFAGLAAVAGTECANRQQAAALLREHIEEEQVVQFLLLSLMRTESGTYTWRLNREGLEAGYDSFRAAPVAELPFDGETLFIRGELSSYVTDAHLPIIDQWFTHNEVGTLPDTGHWLHAERSREFNAAVLEFLL